MHEDQLIANRGFLLVSPARTRPMIGVVRVQLSDLRELDHRRFLALVDHTPERHRLAYVNGVLAGRVTPAVITDRTVIDTIKDGDNAFFEVVNGDEVTTYMVDAMGYKA